MMAITLVKYEITVALNLSLEMKMKSTKTGLRAQKKTFRFRHCMLLK